MDIHPEHTGSHPGTKRRRRRLVVRLMLPLALVAAALGAVWWLTRPPALPVIPTTYLPTVQLAARSCPQLSVPLLAAQIDAESHWNPQADSGQAQGIAQFDPVTWSEWGKDYAGDGNPTVWNPKDAIPSQGAYMCHLFRVIKGIPGDPTQLALAAYNAGPNSVIAAQGVPEISETQNYVTRIEKLVPQYTQTYARQLAASASASASASSGG